MNFKIWMTRSSQWSPKPTFLLVSERDFWPHAMSVDSKNHSCTCRSILRQIISLVSHILATSVAKPPGQETHWKFTKSHITNSTNWIPGQETVLDSIGKIVQNRKPDEKKWERFQNWNIYIYFLISSLFINCITAYQRCFKNNDDDDGNGDGDEYKSHYVDDDE